MLCGEGPCSAVESGRVDEWHSATADAVVVVVIAATLPEPKFSLHPALGVGDMTVAILDFIYRFHQHNSIQIAAYLYLNPESVDNSVEDSGDNFP